MAITAIEIGTDGYYSTGVPSGEVIFTHGWYMGVIAPPTPIAGARAFTDQHLPILPKKSWRK